MEQIISKQEFNELMNLKGQGRGGGIKNEADFVLKEEGEEGLKRLEDTMAELGYPIKYREIGIMKLYPIGLEAVTLVAIKRLFNYDDEKFQEMGKFGTKLSFIIRLFVKYFVSPEKLSKEAPGMWKKGSTVGDLKVMEYNTDKRYLILRLENYDLHPLYCQILKGYFLSGVQMILKSEASCEETKCIYRGDPYHEFLLKW